MGSGERGARHNWGQGPNVLPDVGVEAGDGLAGVHVDELLFKVDGNARLGLGDIVADELALDV
jgi:hypothetical protein